MRRHRRGLMILELTISVVLVGALLTMALRILSWTTREQRAGERRTVALVECGNVLDTLTSLRWGELTKERVSAAKLSAEATAILPEGKLQVTLNQPEGGNDKQVSVSIDWIGDHQVREGPVRLTAWVFK